MVSTYLQYFVQKKYQLWYNSKIFNIQVDLKETEKNACRKLLKTYKIDEDEDENEDEELIEPTEDDGVLTMYMVMEDLLKNDRKRTINDTMQLVQRDYSVIANISKQRSVID